MIIFLLLISTALASQDVCQLPKDVGPCRASKLRFAFNADTGKCEAFLFGGCKGNLNNFRSIQDCHRTCKDLLIDEDIGKTAKEVHVKTPHCLDAPVKGRVSCRAFFPRFTFNSETLKCENFIYGGCGGSANLYLSQEECMTTCYFGEAVAKPPLLRGRMSMMQSRGGPLGAIEDGDAMVIQETDENICQLPPVRPSKFACLAFKQMWTFDSRQGKCIEYVYGGCHGTKNLFDTKAQCESKCPSFSTSLPSLPNAMWIQPPLCKDPPMKGRKSCMAFMPKFTYDANQGLCKPFVYGGCGGSENLFDNELECLKTCDMDYNDDTPSTVEACGLDILAGPCRMSKPMFAFNKETKRCEKFFYGGCKGNDNRFATVEECVNTCGGNEPDESTTLCSEVKCDRGEAMFYEAKGCLPITRKGECCPSSWDCKVWNEQRILRKDQCFWADSNTPNGKFFNIGEDIPEANGGCNVACSCVGEPDVQAEILCASTDCGFPPIVPGADCQGVYENVDDCCPFPKCGAELDELATCHSANVTVKAGQKLYNPKGENPCEVCICQENGELECHNVQCGLGRDRKLLDGCVPVFKEDICCPYDWICPQENQEQTFVPPPPPISTSVQCPPGVNPRSDYQDYLMPPSLEKLAQIGTLSSTRRDSMVTLPAVIHEKRDPCLSSRPEEGACEPYLDRWTFHQGAKVCRAYKTSASEGDLSSFNIFESLAECQSKCAIHMPVTRNCTAKVSREEGRPLRNDRCFPTNKYRFDETKGRCQDFSRLGCKANADSYATLSECKANCEVDQVRQEYPGKLPECNLHPQSGNCKSFLRRYHYDSSSGTCQAFIFSGCRGNKNNFETPGACHKACAPANAPDPNQSTFTYLGNPCEMKKDVGKCKAKKPMFYFDAKTSLCKLFFFGGCGGNANKFHTLEECRSTCNVDKVAQKALDTGLVCQDALKCQTNTWMFNGEKCVKSMTYLVNSTCSPSSGNAFDGQDVCQAYCVSKTATLSSLAQQPRSIEDRVTLPIRVERPGGESRVTLPAQVSRPEFQDPCLLDKVLGKCRAAIYRFYFDQSTGSCKSFFYGGCGGNANNFPSKEACLSKCKRHISEEDDLTSQTYIASEALEQEICSEPMEPGPCRGFKSRYFYNGQKCQRFRYGGCKGNGNNFETRLECIETCGKTATKVKQVHEGCIFNGNAFNVGDVLRLEDTVCSCSSPPSLTCSNDDI